MLRRLLACLALLSGFAALGTPAHAGIYEALDRLEVSAERAERAKPVASPCEQRQQERRQRAEKPAPCEAERAIRIVIPTVMFGPDRAFE